MSFTQFVEWAFLALLGGGIWVLWKIKESVEILNIQIAVVIEKTKNHQSIIEKHDKRLVSLEHKYNFAKGE